MDLYERETLSLMASRFFSNESGMMCHHKGLFQHKLHL